MSRRIRREDIDLRVSMGHDRNTTQSILDPIRRDQGVLGQMALRALIEEGLRSGPARARTAGDRGRLRAIARGDLD